MYILLEKQDEEYDGYLNEYDCCGYTDDEIVAIDWKDENFDNREYKWCPDNEIR